MEIYKKQEKEKKLTQKSKGLKTTCITFSCTSRISGRMWQQCIASPLYGFIPALPALICVDKPCFQSLYILSLLASIARGHTIALNGAHDEFPIPLYIISDYTPGVGMESINLCTFCARAVVRIDQFVVFCFWLVLFVCTWLLFSSIF